MNTLKVNRSELSKKKYISYMANATFMGRLVESHVNGAIFRSYQGSLYRWGKENWESVSHLTELVVVEEEEEKKTNCGRKYLKYYSTVLLIEHDYISH